MKIKHIFLCALSVSLMTACSAVDEPQVQDDGEHVYTLSLSIDLGSEKTRTVEELTTDGVYVYFLFGSEGNYNPGYAVYSSSEGLWTLTTNKGLTEGSGTAEVYYFGPTQKITSLDPEETFSLDGTSPIYKGRMEYNCASDGSVVGASTLTPNVGRLRFRSNTSSAIIVRGINTPYTWDRNTSEIISDTDKCRLSMNKEVDGDRYLSDYVYGFSFDEDGTNFIKVIIGSYSYSYVHFLDCNYHNLLDIFNSGATGVFDLDNDTRWLSETYTYSNKSDFTISSNSQNIDEEYGLYYDGYYTLDSKVGLRFQCNFKVTECTTSDSEGVLAFVIRAYDSSDNLIDEAVHYLFRSNTHDLNSTYKFDQNYYMPNPNAHDESVTYEFGIEYLGVKAKVTNIFINNF